MIYTTCNKCNAKAVWNYAPSGFNYYCDNHVPRGCSCNVDPDSNIEDTDEQGRLMPCCEYDYSATGFERHQPYENKYDDEDN
jgi:hypothetical protein